MTFKTINDVRAYCWLMAKQIAEDYDPNDYGSAIKNTYLDVFDFIEKQWEEEEGEKL